MLVIKLQHQNDIRRVTIEKPIPINELVELARSLFRDTLPSSFILKYKDDEGDLITVASDRELHEAFRLFKDQGILRIIICGEDKKEQLPQQKQTNNQVPNEGKQEKSPLEEFVESLNPYIQAFDEQLNVVLPKLEEQVQGILPNLEQVLPKLEETFKGVFSQEMPQTQTQIHPAVCDSCNGRIVGIRWKCATCPDYDLCEKCKSLNVHSEHSFQKIEKSNWQRCPYRAQRCPYRAERCANQCTQIPVTQEVKVESPKVEKKEEPKKEEIKQPVEETKKEEPKKEEPKKEETKPIESPKVEQKTEEPKKESPFESKLKQLDEMGFANRARNIEILVKRKGDMVLVVKDLLE